MTLNLLQIIEVEIKRNGKIELNVTDILYECPTKCDMLIKDSAFRLVEKNSVKPILVFCKILQDRLQ